MSRTTSRTTDRRTFIAASAGLACQLTAMTAMTERGLLSAAEPPQGRVRATDGDDQSEPKWDEQVTIRVGRTGGDLNGADDRVVQAACDYVARLGGGTVQILPGVYTFRNSVYIPSKIRIVGSGAETILTKGASESIDLGEDSDWYDREITLAKNSGFRVGDGVVLFGKNAHNGDQEVIKRTLVAKSGNQFKLSAGLRKNLWLSGKPRCASVFPLLTSEFTSDVVIENLTIDGNGKQNENLNGNYGGCIFLQDCKQYTFRNVETRNYNGDGISFQICHDVRIEDCHSHDNADLGFHPGSGSQRPVILNSKMANNNIGLFWCWGVKFGLAENNQMIGNRNYGISIGHNDTDNVMRNNVVENSGLVGILFRDDSRGVDFWANRNLVENNKIVNSGGETGVAIDIHGKTKDLIIRNNQLSETRAPAKRIGIRVGAQSERVALDDNKVEGFAQEIVRKA
jgi:hypothetical protein